MKRISSEEQKKIILEILRFFDKKCRENNIKYSLISGSLIGAVRHKGFIPWDDDLDIVLTKRNYERIKRILDMETGRYQILKREKGGDHFSFIKLIDTHTQLQEGGNNGFNPHYGLFIDIFCYYPTSNNLKERKEQMKKLKLLVSLIARRRLDLRNASFFQNIMRFGKNIISVLMGYDRINKSFEKTLNRFDDSKYVVSNWPVYDFEKEIQLARNTKNYIDVPFENLTVMIFENYHEILSTMYGDYMKLPPIPERVSRHNMKMWWREDPYA